MRHKIILSAELSTKRAAENLNRTLGLRNILECMGVDFETVHGCYKGSTETSFIVDLLGDVQPSVADLRKVANDYEQESILWIRASGKGYLLYNDGREQCIGTFKRIDSYTRINDDVFICEPELDTTHTNIRSLSHV